MKVSNSFAIVLLAGLTVVAVHLARRHPAQPPRADRALSLQAADGKGEAPFSCRSSGRRAIRRVIERGRALYSVTCSACHGVDARGGQLGGPNLLRSQLVLGRSGRRSDHPGRPEGPSRQGHAADADPRGRRQGRRRVSAQPARGSRAARARRRQRHAAAGRPRRRCDRRVRRTSRRSARRCHSPTGDLQGIAATSCPSQGAAEPLGLRRHRGGRGGGRGGRGRGVERARPSTVTVTLPSGEKVEGQLRRIDDFLVTLVQADGTMRSFRRDGDVPKVEIRDPLEAHRDLLAVYTDKDMHDVTAYLVTLK